MPKFNAAFCVLKRVRKLELKNNKPNVLCWPNSLFLRGFSFIFLASSIQELMFSMSFMDV